MTSCFVSWPNRPVSVCWCPSVISQYCVKMAAWIELVFDTQASLGLNYSVFEQSLGLFKNNGTSLLNFPQTLDLEKFGHSLLTILECGKQAKVTGLLLTTLGDGGHGQVLSTMDRRRVVCFSHSASSFVYNTMGATRICWWQLNLETTTATTTTTTTTTTIKRLFSRTTWVSQYRKGRTILDFTDARDDGWQWHQLDHVKIINHLDLAPDR